MKKILFFINTLSIGGAELVLTDTANALADKYSVTVMTLKNGGVHEQRLNSNVSYKSMIKCRNRLIRRVLEYLICFIIPPTVIHKIFIGNRYDYEIAFLEGVPTKIISASKTKKYAWVHIDLVNTFGLEKIHRNMQKHIECYKKFDKIICVSETVKKAFSKRFGITERLEVKYNVLDDLLIKQKAIEEVQKKDKFEIVSVGRLVRQKGYDRLLKVFKRLHDDGIDCRLTLIGEGPERGNLKKYAEENGISDNIELTGFLKNPYKYMKNADLIVFPSRAEGYSTVATEAVILGKPIVVSDCSGMKEIFGDSEYGIVTDSDEALYDSVKKMICDIALREHYAKKASERAEEFSKAQRIAAINELFCE